MTAFWLRHCLSSVRSFVIKFKIVYFAVLDQFREFTNQNLVKDMWTLFKEI